MNIHVTIDGETFGAALKDSPAARDLSAQLTATVPMIDRAGVEKTGPLPGPLPLGGQPEGADSDVGNLGCYAPNRNLVRDYGDQSYYPGIVLLGRLHSDAAPGIAALTSSSTATVEDR